MKSRRFMESRRFMKSRRFMESRRFMKSRRFMESPRSMKSGRFMKSNNHAWVLSNHVRSCRECRAYSAMIVSRAGERGMWTSVGGRPPRTIYQSVLQKFISKTSLQMERTTIYKRLQIERIDAS